MKYSNCTVVKTLILVNVLNKIAASVASTSSNSAIANHNHNHNHNPYSSSSAGVFASASSSSSDDSDADDNQILSDIELDDETPDDDDNVDDAAEYDENDQGSDSSEDEESSSNSMMQQIHTDGETTDADGGSPSSQPLRTLKKLQAMLEETDYATATSASASASASSSNNANSNANAAAPNSGNTMEYQYPERQTPLVAQPIEQEERRYPYPQRDAQQTINSSYPQPQQQQQQQQNTLQSRQRVERIASPRYDSDDDQSEEIGQLWTSKDRSKYKKQRKLQREREMQNQRQRYLEQQEQHIQSDDDSHGTDMTDDTDDGLGYTLPNLPVYFSDAESTDESDHETANTNEKQITYQSPTGIPPQSQATHNHRPMDDSSTSTITNQNNQPTSQKILNQSGALQQYDPHFQRRPPQQQGQSPPYHYHNMPYQQPPSSQQGPQPQSHIPPGPHQYPYSPYQQQQQQQQPSQSQQRPQQQMPQGPQQQMPQGQYPYQPPTYIYNNPNSYGPMNPQQQQYMQQMQQQQHYQSWATNQPGYSMPYPPQHYYQSHNQSPMQTQPQMQGVTSNARPGFIPQSSMPSPPQQSGNSQMRPIDQSNTFQQINGRRNDLPQTVVQTSTDPSKVAVTLAEAGALITFDSMQKIAFFSMGTCILSYCAVSPRTLEMAEYNAQFKKIVQRVMLTFIVPLITFLLLVLEVKENDLNSLVNTFYTSATLGYFFAFMMEVFATTIIRLGVFWIWEPSIFDLTPDVPMIILPWTLRELSYRPKRITLFAADFAATCIAAPIIEEFMKLKVVQLSTKLPRNYRWRKLPKNESNGKKKKRKRNKYVLEEIERKPGEVAVTNINSYTSHMLAASLGMKFSDTTRRVHMYTKGGDAHKSFYAFFRGVYPIHELCGSMTALELAKRDVLGLNVPLWRMLLPAVFIHGLANLKGMKPIFKWNSSTPWSEIQMSPWYIRDSSTLSQTISKFLPKLMWFVIMGRVLGYILKNYYMIGRKAVKRTTTFAGKNASFSAEMETSELLKKTKKDKKDRSNG